MHRVLIDLNRNLAKLNGKFTELLYMFYDEQMRKLMDKIISRSSTLFFEIVHALEQLKMDRVAELLLGFLDEADALMDDIAWRIALKPVEKISHTIRELLQVIRAQVIFLDQYRQSKYTF